MIEAANKAKGSRIALQCQWFVGRLSGGAGARGAKGRFLPSQGERRGGGPMTQRLWLVQTAPDRCGPRPYRCIAASSGFLLMSGHAHMPASGSGQATTHIGSRIHGTWMDLVDFSSIERAFFFTLPIFAHGLTARFFLFSPDTKQDLDSRL